MLRTLACLGGAALVSVYWVVSSLAALGAGESVAVGGVWSDRRRSRRCSLHRGAARAGTWFLYGADAAGAFRPTFQAYITSPPVVVASFALVVAAFVGAAVSRSRVRGLAVALVAVGAVAMVGIYPPSHPPALRSVLTWAFHNVPGALAFRTTTKAGAVELVGLVLLAGLAADALVPRLRDALAAGVALVGGLAVLAMSVAPAVSGGLYPGRLPLPAYWTTAAADLRPPREPGSGVVRARRDRRDLPVGAAFRRRHGPWADGPADAHPHDCPQRARGGQQRDGGGRLRHPVRHRRAGHALGVGPLLRRERPLGAQRHVWEFVGGGRPSVVTRLVGSDPGLTPSALYGEPGEYTASGLELASADPLAQFQEATLVPLLRYAVVSPGSMVRSTPGSTLLVAGDGSAVDGLVRYGLVDGSGEFRAAWRD